MAEPFIGEVRIFGFDFPPVGWSQCNGQLIPTSQNQALYSLLQNQYGGTYPQTFGLPDMRGRVPMSHGDLYNVGTMYGFETVTLDTNELPTHNHPFSADSGPGDKVTPIKGHTFAAASNDGLVYGAATSLVQLNPNGVGSSGGGQGHNNMQPSLALNFCIATQGLYPPRQ